MNSYQYFLVICKITLDLYVTDLDHLMIDLISLCFTVLNFKLIITIIESKLSGYFVDFTPILPTLWPTKLLLTSSPLNHISRSTNKFSLSAPQEMYREVENIRTDYRV